MDRLPKGRQLLFFLLIGVTGALGAVSVTTLMLLPALLGFVLAAWGNTYYALSVTAAFAGIVAVMGVSPDTLYSLAAFLPASFIIGVTLKYKRPYRVAMGGSAACMGIALYLQLCLPSILAGNDPFAFLITTFEDLSQALNQALAAMGGEDIQQYLRLLRTMLPELAVLMITSGAMLFGFLDVLIARGLALKQGMELKPMAKIYDWQVSRSFLGGTAVMVLGIVVVSWLSLKNLEAIRMSIECVIIAPYALSGLGFLEFVSTYVFRKQGTGWYVLHAAFIALLFPYSIALLAIAGFIDRVFNLRARYRNRLNDG